MFEIARKIMQKNTVEFFDVFFFVQKNFPFFPLFDYIFNIFQWVNNIDNIIGKSDNIGKNIIYPLENIFSI